SVTGTSRGGVKATLARGPLGGYDAGALTAPLQFLHPEEPPMRPACPAAFARVVRLALLVASLGFVATRATAQTTYTWNQTGTASYATATNWTPDRTTPATNDVLVFNNGATTTVTGVPAQTIGQLTVTNSTNVALQAAATGTLTIAGGSGTDLSVDAGSQLNVNTATALTLALPAGSTGSISGAITLSAGAHRLTAASASGITFQSGATFTEGTSFSGNAFGTTNLKAIVFARG